MSAVFRTLSDDKTLVLLDTITVLGLDQDPRICKLGLTRKQYYSRIRSLTNSGLITRQKGKYYLTSLGKIVSFYHLKIGRAVDSFWKLKALDSICNEAINDPGFKDVFPNLVNDLIDDVEIREILTPLDTKSTILHEIKIKAYTKIR